MDLWYNGRKHKHSWTMAWWKCAAHHASVNMSGTHTENIMQLSWLLTFLWILDVRSISASTTQLNVFPPFFSMLVHSQENIHQLHFFLHVTPLYLKSLSWRIKWPTFMKITPVTFVWHDRQEGVLLPFFLTFYNFSKNVPSHILMSYIYKYITSKNTYTM